MPEKEIIGHSANAAVGGCFAFTLPSIDIFISISLGGAVLDSWDLYASRIQKRQGFSRFSGGRPAILDCDTHTIGSDSQ